MHNSQLLSDDIYRSWGLIVLILLLVIGYHYLENKISTQLSKNITNIEKLIHTEKPVDTKAIQLTYQQIIEQQYKNAKFLSVVKTNDHVTYTSKDLYCLAKNIYHEAGYEPERGKYAVAQVTINRTRDPKFSGTICEVVMADNQFSWTNIKKLRDKRPQGTAWKNSLNVAQATLRDGFRVKGLENALYYHADYVHPRWHNVTKLAQIGAHIFYNPA